MVDYRKPLNFYPLGNAAGFNLLTGTADCQTVRGLKFDGASN